jgi:hypothetical protein
VSGALVMDSRPRFPPPTDLVEAIPLTPPSLSLQNLMLTWNVNFPDLNDISQFLLLLANLATYSNNQAHNPLFWRDEFFLALKIYPLAHELTSLPKYPLLPEQYHSDGDGVTIREILRITSILFFGLMKKRFEVEPNGIHPNCGKISKLLQLHPVNWSRFLEFRLWILAISALVEEGEERKWFVSEIAYTMINLGFNTWDDAVGCLKSLVWIHEMVAKETFALGQEIELFQSRYAM